MVVVRNEEDVEYINRKIRNDFDELDEQGIMLHADELIARAERLGLTELAQEMKNDLKVTE